MAGTQPKDKNGLTPMEESFCQAVAMGETYSGALRIAYPTENYNQNSLNVQASKMMSKPKITLRVDKLREEHRERNAVTVDSVTKKLEIAYEMSIKEKQNASAVSAQMGVAKLHGLLTDKVEHMGNVDFTVKLPE